MKTETCALEFLFITYYNHDNTSGSFEYGMYFLIYEELKLTQIGYNLFDPRFSEKSYIPSKFLN